jgi:hypothetical protein
MKLQIYSRELILNCGKKPSKVPPRLLDSLTIEDYQMLIADKDFMAEYHRVIQKI